MRHFWIVFWGACAVLVIVSGVLRVLARARQRHHGAPISLDDAAVRRIIDEGVLAPEEEEPLDLDRIQEEERRFWGETWDEAEEW